MMSPRPNPMDTMDEQMTPLQLLRRGRSRILHGGLIKGSFRGFGGQHQSAYCTVGALGDYGSDDCPDDPSFSGNAIRARHQLEAAMPANPPDIPGWKAPYAPGLMTYNDLPSTTREDVLALYDKAIAQLETSEGPNAII